LTWIDPWGLSCSSDAKELAGNLGRRPSQDYRAHHIVMSNSTDPRMVTLRTKMKTLGIPINSSENGAWMPKDASSRLPGDLSTAHTGEGVHGDAYKQYVFDNLNSANTEADFNAGLSKIQGDLAGGKKFPTK
ncbi:AHH domain-containing protein, partial [Paraburkholderia sp. J67]|uniref:AHH domain-containing protein n=1 Tax=Paraburkholderia sp. J67 TaxID=2805435 RepID=UPI002ABE1945